MESKIQQVIWKNIKTTHTGISVNESGLMIDIKALVNSERADAIDKYIQEKLDEAYDDENCR